MNPKITAHIIRCPASYYGNDTYVALGITITYPDRYEATYTLKLSEHEYNILDKNKGFPIFPEHFFQVLADRING